LTSLASPPKIGGDLRGGYAKHFMVIEKGNTAFGLINNGEFAFSGLLIIIEVLP